MPSAAASRRAPPWPKSSVRWPQFGQQNTLMFSTRPSTGTSVFSNMRTPRRASINAMSCGVDTMTAPLRLTFCAMVSCASPVPGGMSTIRMSSAPQCTWPIICSNAPITIGPRQIIAVSGSTRKPIDMADRPHACNGTILPSRVSGLRSTPSMRGRLGP